MSEDDEMIKHTRNFHKEIRIYLNFCILMKRKKKKEKKINHPNPNIIIDNSISANRNKRFEENCIKRLEISSIKGNRRKLPVTGSIRDNDNRILRRSK